MCKTFLKPLANINSSFSFCFTVPSQAYRLCSMIINHSEMITIKIRNER
jgi:hypothetical protein